MSRENTNRMYQLIRAGMVLGMDFALVHNMIEPNSIYGLNKIIEGRKKTLPIELQMIIDTLRTEQREKTLQ